ncbi:MAG: hypothetical protein IJ864_02015 [Alphaproteobacteria bacterium]|nr:hypothetical protein [Alphaproteobacteria bacterium]
MEKNCKTSQGKKAFTAKEVEAMGFSVEEPKRLRSFKSSPFYRMKLNYDV